MRLQNKITGATIEAHFENASKPGVEEPILMLEEESGNLPLSKQGVSKFTFLEGTDVEKRTAEKWGYHFGV